MDASRPFPEKLKTKPPPLHIKKEDYEYLSDMIESLKREHAN